MSVQPERAVLQRISRRPSARVVGPAKRLVVQRGVPESPEEEDGTVAAAAAPEPDRATQVRAQRPGRSIRRAQYAQRRLGRQQLPPLRLPPVPANFDTDTVTVAAIVHVGNATLWEELERYLEQLVGDWHLFVTLLRLGGNAPVLRSRIQLRFPGAHVMVVDNVGMDVGPFLLVLDHIKQQGLRFDYILKLHTKSDRNWRDELIRPLLGSREHLRRLFYVFHSHPEIGMIGSRRRIYSKMGLNKKYVDEYLQRIRQAEASPASRRAIGQPLAWSEPRSRQFVGGTMFLVRFEIFERVLRNVDLQAWYRELPVGRVQDISSGQRPHALERVFGGVLPLTGHKLLGV